MSLFRRSEEKKTTAGPTEADVRKALEAVQDPDLHESIVKLGFVKNVRICDGAVAFDVELTTPACPVKEKMKSEAEQAVKVLPGVTTVAVNMTSQVRSSIPSNSMEGLKQVKNIIAISSGKGGVGKSTVSVNLALSLARTGAKVGLMDADVYGPSVPKMLAGNERPEGREGKILPITRYGVRFMSMALLTDADTPVIWRGPMATKLVQQFLGQVEWGELDYLLIDLPPGTGDVQLTLTQSAPLTGAVVVTTPQDVAVSVTMRGIRMFDQVQVPILGVIENMSGFVCPHCDKTTDIFRQGGGEKTAKELGFRFLGRIPIDPKLTLAGDEGRPVVDVQGKDRPPSAIAFDQIARDLAAQVSVVSRLTASVEAAPKKITEDGKNVVIEWSDGLVTSHPFRALRLACPCAECVDEWTGQKRLDEKKVPLDVKALGFRTVGRYGLQITWSDGHSTGIFMFNNLRKAGPSAVSSASPSNGGDLKERITEALKTVYDPEIPVNIYELGLVYNIGISPENNIQIDMTLTAPACPEAETIPGRVEAAVLGVEGVKDVRVNIVWDPPWTKEMMSEVARVQLGL